MSTDEIKKILIANRGEIAVRIIRTCKEMGIKTVAVHSTADNGSKHLELADESICIGPPESAKSYLNINQIIATAEITHSDAIHPGYGFLSENNKFAEICESAGFKFIGPSHYIIDAVGNKKNAKKIAKAAGVPTIPSYEDKIHWGWLAKSVAHKIGFPVIIKAATGGGGRGMRLVHSAQDLKTAYETAQHEAQKAFGDPTVYIEKYFPNAHHIEVQILGDKYGNIITLGERDCSIQRRYQKLIEESPSPFLNDAQREKIFESALKFAKQSGYNNAGTVEFLVDDFGNHYFMEMNSRLQVEHPITEERAGIDLVMEQILIAQGEKLRYAQGDISLKGHAIECRINAENPEKNFMPSPGKIINYFEPSGKGIRVDTHAFNGYVVPPTYDSLVAKLIAHAPNREQAINRMKTALSTYILEGIKTTIPFYIKVMDNPQYIEGKYDTSFVLNNMFK